MNPRVVIILLLAATAFTGCRLTRIENLSAATAELTPLPTESPIPTVSPSLATVEVTVIDERIEATSDVVAVADGSTAVDRQQFVLPDCVVNHPEWPIYIVKAGDTLLRIANRIGSTVSILAQVNCLVDPNQIYVGQVLRVPLTYVPPQPVEPPPDIPLIDIGPQPAHICVVVPNDGQANIYGAGVTGGPAAILVGTVRFVRRADNAFIVELPPGGVQGWVSATEAHLEGTSCPTGASPTPSTPGLPRVGYKGTPPNSACSVVKSGAPGVRYLYGGTSSAHAPIAIMDDYLPFLARVSGGYEVIVPDWDMTGWLPSDGVALVGSGCPA